MESEFFKHWFGGFEEALAGMCPDERAALMSHCARACSASYSLGVYQKAYAKAKNLDEFLLNLKESFSEFNYAVSEDRRKVTITMNRCLCDLYTCGYVKTGHLCECSRLSCQYNWEAVMGAGSVNVELKQSILRGDPSCILEVNLR